MKPRGNVVIWLKNSQKETFAASYHKSDSYNGLAQAVAALNAFYDVLTPYLLHFVAVRRTIGSKYVRRYEKTAQTPCRRILEHAAVDEDAKAAIREACTKLNLLVPACEMERLIAVVYDIQKRYGKSRL